MGVYLWRNYSLTVLWRGVRTEVLRWLRLVKVIIHAGFLGTDGSSAEPAGSPVLTLLQAMCHPLVQPDVRFSLARCRVSLKLVINLCWQLVLPTSLPFLFYAGSPLPHTSTRFRTLPTSLCSILRPARLLASGCEISFLFLYLETEKIQIHDTCRSILEFGGGKRKNTAEIRVGTKVLWLDACVANLGVGSL